MQRDGTEKTLSESRRKEIFLSLVEAQDQKMTVEQSREMVAKRFGLSLSQVRKVEHEGLDNEWSPRPDAVGFPATLFISGQTFHFLT